MRTESMFPKAQWFGLDKQNQVFPLQDRKESDQWWARNEKRANIAVTKVDSQLVWTRFNGVMLDPTTDLSPDGQPRVFDTKVFCDSANEKSDTLWSSHASFDEALQGHESIVDQLKQRAARTSSPLA